MPLIPGKSKEAFSRNVKTEMNHGKDQKQSLAIAYAMKRRHKMAEGGLVENEDLHPTNEPEHGAKEAVLKEMDLSPHEESHGQLPHLAEPMTHERAAEEDMGREDAMIGRIRSALRMAKGGMVPDDETHKPMPNEDRMLAMKDSYPEGPAESDTQAQDEGFGNKPLNNEMGDEDQEESRRRMASRAISMARMEK